MSGHLDCSGCRVSFPVRAGVPRLLPPDLAAAQKEIARRFGYEWTRYAHFHDLYTEQFLDWIAPVERSFFAGKTVLDAGCGKGRHLRLAAEFGAAVAIGVDMSDAVDVAFVVTRDMPNAHVVQGDLFHLPFSPSFDYAYSIGVIDHTPDPRKAFTSIVSKIKPQGSISVWVYGKEGNGWITGIMDPIRKTVFSRAPLWFVKATSAVLGIILVAVLRLVYGPLGKTAIGRFLPYNAYLTSVAHFPLNEMTSIIFDHLVPPEAHYLPETEVRSWFASGFQQVSVTRRNQNSWRGFGTRMV